MRSAGNSGQKFRGGRKTRGLSRYISGLILAIATCVPAAAVACDCTLLPADQRAVERVQSSWPRAYSAIQTGDFGKALRELRTTSPLISSIHDASARACVAAGANNLSVSAAAGKAYLSRHPHALAGAKTAAGRAWRVFLNCR